MLIGKKPRLEVFLWATKYAACPEGNVDGKKLQRHSLWKLTQGCNITKGKREEGGGVKCHISPPFHSGSKKYLGMLDTIPKANKMSLLKTQP